jgi:hypothetical protein
MRSGKNVAWSDIDMGGTDMQEAQQVDWDAFFRQRATARADAADAITAEFYAVHPYEVFLGAETRRVRAREPAFTTFEQAQRWARGQSDGGEWRVRSSLTGELVTAPLPAQATAGEPATLGMSSKNEMVVPSIAAEAAPP